MLSLNKSLFSMKNNAILHNRVILYFIFLVSLGNLFYLSVERDFTSISIFLLVGFLTSFFSKNMLIIMFVALITTAILKNKVSEGLENQVEVDVPEDAVEDVVEEDVVEEDATGEDNNDLSNEKYLEEEDEEIPANVKKPKNTKKKVEKEVLENYEDPEEEQGLEEEDAEEEYVVEPFSGW